jgi:2'-5' RNA ligase
MTRPETHKLYFIAIVCPPDIDEKITQFKLWMQARFGCRVALRSPGHITLVPPFWLDESRQDELTSALNRFASESEEITISLNDFSHFSDRVLFVNVDENPSLGSLRKQTEDHFLQPFEGIIKPDDRPFHPHVTIANRDVMPGTFVKAWEHFSKEKFSASFTTSELCLLKLIDGRWKVIETRQWK